MTTQESLAETAAALRTVEEIQRRAEEKLQELIRHHRQTRQRKETERMSSPRPLATGARGAWQAGRFKPMPPAVENSASPDRAASSPIS